MTSRSFRAIKVIRVQFLSTRLFGPNFLARARRNMLHL